MKIFNIIFCLLFIISAGLQYNDPDPWLWIPIYLYGAVLCWLAFRGKHYPLASWLGIAGYAVYAIILFFEKDGVWEWLTRHDAANIAATMKAETPWIEDTREFFGLVILIAVLLINLASERRKDASRIS